MESERRAHTSVLHSVPVAEEEALASIELFEDFEAPPPAAAKASSENALGVSSRLAEPDSPAAELVASKTKTPVPVDLGDNVELF